MLKINRRIGIKRTNFPLQHRGRHGQIKQAFRLIDFGGITGQGIILLLRFDIIPLAQRPDNQLRADLCQFVVQFSAGRFRRDFGFAFQQHVAGIQPGVHFHCRNAAFFVAGLNCPLDRRRAAPSRQQRTVNVDTAERKGFQHRRRQNQTIGGNHRHIGVERGKFRLFFGIAQCFRRTYFNTLLFRPQMHRRFHQFVAAAGNFRFFSVNGQNFMFGSQLL